MERKLEAAQESIGDHQQTIVKFRDLVAKLQVRAALLVVSSYSMNKIFNMAGAITAYPELLITLICLPLVSIRSTLLKI